MNHRHQKREEYMKELAAEFISRESNRNSLITVTRMSLSHHEDSATVYVSVMPETQENAVMDFLSRQLSDFREFVKSKIQNGKIPMFTFVIDEGSKLVRKIEKLNTL
jgi:ribosome-binding factor A